MRKHYYKCSNYLPKKEMDNKYNLIVKFGSYLDMVNYGRELTELEENLGWRWDSSDDEPYHILRKEHIFILDAIRYGNLEELKTLNNNEIKIDFYIRVMIHLAVKFKHIDIINYLLNTNQLNVQLSKVIGEFDDGTIMKELIKVRCIDKFILSGKRDDSLPSHMPLWEWYESMKYINIKDVYISALIYNNNELLNEIKKCVKIDNDELKKYYVDTYGYKMNEKCVCDKTYFLYKNSSGEELCSHCYFTELLQHFN
jgi:hypothetical protein